MSPLQVIGLSQQSAQNVRAQNVRAQKTGDMSLH